MQPRERDMRRIALGLRMDACAHHDLRDLCLGSLTTQNRSSIEFGI